MAGAIGYFIGYVFGSYQEWMDFTHIEPIVTQINKKFRFRRNGVIRGQYMCHFCHSPIYEDSVGIDKIGYFHFTCKV